MFHENFDENIFDEWNTYLISPTVEKVKEENWEYESVSQNLNLSITQRNIYQDYLMDQIKQLPKQYDSGLPNQYMLAALSEVLLLPLFVVIILLANIFSIEKEQKTDQIIYPTSASQRKITIAKLLSGYFFAIGLMLLPILIVYMFSTIVFPIHCWDLLVTLLDFKSIDLLIPTTYLTLLINAILLSLISTIAIATLTMFLSYFMKNRFVVIVMMFVFMLVGMVTSVIYIQADWFHIFSFSHPFCMVLYQSYFSQTSMLWGMPIDFGVPYLFNETMVIPVRWIVMGGWVILSLFLSSWIYINSRKILLLKFSQT